MRLCALKTWELVGFVVWDMCGLEVKGLRVVALGPRRLIVLDQCGLVIRDLNI
jgi:hypothetical protein